MRLRERYRLSFGWHATVLPLEVFLNFGVARHEVVYLRRPAAAVDCRLMFNGYGGRKSLSSSSICLLLRRIQIWCFGTRKREKLTVDNYNACQSFTEQFSATVIDLLQHFQWYALLLISLLAFYSADDSLLHGSTSRILIGKHPIHSMSGFFDRVAISFL